MPFGVTSAIILCFKTLQSWTRAVVIRSSQRRVYGSRLGKTQNNIFTVNDGIFK